MNPIELTEYIIKNLVEDPEMVSVKQFDDEENIINVQVLVDSKEIGSVIGKGGKIANAIRTVVQAASYANDNKKIIINIDSF
ncbi:MAG: KH domain-containing protein [Bacilli bacterium]|nr:KH domain-containing protein [Bacilli bacterium]MDD4734162.1 KH domain-containing protein [Bacilli bacterium]